ncbi:MAG: hypothetical protein ACQES4_05365 [Bacillota bacterium]
MTDKEKIPCPVCGREVNSDDLYCKYCGSELKASPAFTEDEEEEQYPELDLREEDVGKTVEELESEFSELDYEPKKKSGFLVPVLIIILVLGMVAGGIYIFSRPDDDQAANGDSVEVPDVEEEDEQPGADDPNGEVSEPADPDQENGENGEAETPPDHELLEAAVEEWVAERVDDPDVILLNNEELDNFEEFFEEYDLAEDNVIVYRVESTEDEFATVLMGLPFSEWSIKAVFIWREGQWDFLREETMG